MRAPQPQPQPPAPARSAGPVRAAAFAALTALTTLAACGSPRGGVPDEPPTTPSTPVTPVTPMTQSSLSIEVSVSGDGTAAATVRCTARNVSGRELHVLDWRRLPYLLDEGGGLVVLHGVHPPPADRDLNIIEIPTTRPLAAGEALTFEAKLSPLVLHGHYGEEPSPPRHGPVEVRCQVGHGATPILEAARHQISINTLLEWQHLETSPTVIVKLP